MINPIKFSIKKPLRTIIIALILINLFFLNNLSAQAITTSYRAGIVVYSPAKKITLKAGVATKLRINYINNGSTSWLNSGASAVKLKTDPTGQNFIHSQWLSNTVPTKLYYPKVAPGKSIWFDVPIVAPKTNGTYSFNVSLIAGSTNIGGSSATFTITITGGKEPVTTSAPPLTNGFNEVLSFNTNQKTSLPITIENDNYQLRSGGQIFTQQILGNRFQIDFNFELKKYFINNQYNQRILMTDQPIDFLPVDTSAVSKLTSGSNYSFCGNLKFEYIESSSALKILTNATEACRPKIIAPTPPSLPAPTAYFWQSIPSEINMADAYRFNEEPIIKVGLFYQTSTDQKKLPIKIKTLNQQSYDLKDLNNNLLIKATSGDTLEIDYDFRLNKYFVNSNGQRLLMTDQPLYFVGSSTETIFEISSWQNGPFWGMNVNDNDYRGNLIIKYNPNTERLWLINEITMEKYLWGNSEIWDTWPTEMLKAQMIAARTYALFRYLNPKYTNSPDPDEDPIFTVRATQADQVYRGYQGELRNPNTVQAVNATRAVTAVYNNDPILAYYFSQTDGRTRSSVEAGMTKAAVDYLKSVNDPPGQGKTLKGHGVGLPQYGGKAAADQGANFSQILKYYYTNIELKRLYP